MKLAELHEDLTQKDLDEVERFADALWGKLKVDVKFTKHFIERLNDERNGKDITKAELIRLFKKERQRYGKDVSELNSEDEAVFMDLLTDINLPFVVKDVPRGKALVSKTIMRKKNFKSDDPAYKIESML